MATEPGAALEIPRESTIREARTGTEGETEGATARPPDASQSGPVLFGRVQEPDGSPLAGAAVTIEIPDLSNPSLPRLRSDVESRSDPGGRFVLPRPQGYCWVLADTTEWTTAVPHEFVPDRPEIEAVVVVGRRNDYGGVVVDAEGRGLADVPIVVAMSPATARGLLPGRERSHSIEWKARTQADGRFEFEGVAWTQGLAFTATSTGLRPTTLVLPEASDLDLRVVLRAEEEFLVGTVLDPEGQPAPGSTVFLDTASTTADGGGRFAFPKPDLEAEHALVAVLVDHLPARLAIGGRIAVPDPLVLVLGGPPLSISGRTVDGEGHPVAGALVWIEDRTLLDRVVTRRDGAVGISGFATAENLMAGAHSFVNRFRSGPDGRFEVRGLLPRAYPLWACELATFSLVSMPAVEAGTRDLVLVLEEESPTRRIAGRALSLSGSPIQGLRVTVSRTAGSGLSIVSAPLRIEGAPVTDAEGRFAIEAIHVGDSSIWFSGDGILSMDEPLELDPSQDLEHLEIRLPMKCSVQVRLRDASEADQVVVRDEAGRYVSTEQRVGLTSSSDMPLEFVDGVSEVFSTGENARWLVLMKAGKEVRRVPIQLVVGQVTTIRP